ncbi:DUF1566 domain-containing protein [Ottowia sp. SB7-C50]|uniref:Lcl C-terminal domain-containing protein n=1 Tax=Ottowia sp. SB7-C50 TaxID=3081231 RepID=UPI002954C4D4|nr:DUF1566 domain-containing protein [Ottowia sp. SB7-C50]WOP16490.1 DUF1566 domain-containing protein [Ottowia sp. SB7-C50]
MTHTPTRVLCAASSILMALAALFVHSTAYPQTAPLNDTGQSRCFDGTSLVACTATNTGDTAAYPRQDGRFGRDAQATFGALSKVGGGAAGFDFTRICWNGAAEGTAGCTGTLVANGTGTASATPTTDWACTRDNVTGLVWSLQTQTATWTAAAAAAYPNAGHNSATRCGYSSGWRLPTRRELLSIVNYGVWNPAIDSDYFPLTNSAFYLTGDFFFQPETGRVWAMDFKDGSGFITSLDYSSSIRLIRAIGN